MGNCAPPATQPCADDPCSEDQVCAVGPRSVVCVCEPGLALRADPDRDDYECVSAEIEPSDLCDPNPCEGSGRTECRVVNDVAACSCAPGLVEGSSGEACVPESGGPCDPNPCLEERRRLCQAVGQVAICRCDEGYVDAGDVCEVADPCLSLVCLEPNRERCEITEGDPTRDVCAIVSGESSCVIWT